MRSILLLSFALLPTAALAQARTISSVAPETTMTAAISGSPAISSALAAGEPAHITPHVSIREVIRTDVDGDPIGFNDIGNTMVFGHPNYETSPKLIKWSNVAVNAADLDKAAGETSVSVSLMVDRQGNPENVQIAHSASPELDRSVLAAVKDFRFKAATEEHIPVEKRMTVTVVFAKN